MRFNEAWAIRVKGPAKVVLLCLAWRMNGQDEVRVPLSVICADTGLAKSTVCRALIELEAAGLLARKSPGGRAQASYRIIPPQLSHSGSQSGFVSQSGTPVDKRDIPMDQKADTAKSRLDPAHRAIRRKRVLGAFRDLCELYPEPVKVTVSMLARELGSRPASVRADMDYLLKHRDIPFDLIDRFGKAKPNFKAIARMRAEREAFRNAEFRSFERGEPA